MVTEENQKQGYTLELLPFKKQYLADILKLYEDPEFRFRTAFPNYLDEDEIEGIIEENTVLIIYNNKVIGLVEFEEIVDAAR
ncbi:hypothetical protein J4G37_55715, partial [Microvirga sp. 3-52]|nr:hypothetical protein [Microvirga sp. 3-52]